MARNDPCKDLDGSKDLKVDHLTKIFTKFLQAKMSSYTIKPT